MAVVACAAVVAVLVPSLGGDAAQETPVPGEQSADAGFARDMQVHHAQAVEMSFLILDRTEDPLVKSMALDIASTQQHQIGQMYAWLELWGVSQTGSAPAMAWMNSSALDDPHHPEEEGTGASVPMPGMATQTEMDRLQETSGAAAERLWLRLMIRHHLGGIDMAQTALDLAADPEVKQLAEAMVSSQQSEVDQMRQMLEGPGR